MLRARRKKITCARIYIYIQNNYCFGQSSVISSPSSSLLSFNKFLSVFDCIDDFLFDFGFSGDDEPARLSSLISLYS